MPRILKWENKKTGRCLRFKCLERTYFSHDDLLVLQVLVSTEQEMNSSYYQSNVAARREMGEEFGKELFYNVGKVEKRGKEKLIDECQPSSSTTSLDKVMEELLVVKQEVREMKQMLASVLDIFKKGNINVPFEADCVFQTTNPIRPNLSCGVNAEVGINIRSENVTNEDDIIFGGEHEGDNKLVNDKVNKIEEKNPNAEIVSGEDGLFQSTSPIRPNSSCGMDTEVGINIGSENVTNEDDDVIFGGEHEGDNKLEDDSE